MITIVGVGALASLFAARLGPHAPVRMLGSWAEAVRAINRFGLTLETESGRQSVRVQATSDAAECLGADIAVVLVKSWQTSRAARQVGTFLAPSGLAVTLQNGIGNLETLAAEIGPERAALGITMQGATLVGPGHVREGGRGPVHLAEHPRLGPLVELLRAAGFEVHLALDVTSLVWGKLVVNAAINPLTALLRLANGELLARPQALALMEEVAREAAAVAAGKGVRLPFADPPSRVREVAQATAQNRSSMFQDILRGAPTEIEAINGAIVREAQALGLRVPVNETLYRLVRAASPD